jgi:hypothetical protein
MKLNALISGLTILRPYYNDHDRCHTGAEHDQFYAWKTDRPLSPIDAASMFALGWFQPGVPYLDGGRTPNYDPDDCWSAFT